MHIYWNVRMILEREDDPRDGRVGDAKRPGPPRCQLMTAADAVTLDDTRKRNLHSALMFTGRCSDRPPSLLARVRARQPPMIWPHSEASYLEPSSRANRLPLTACPRCR